MNSIRVHVIHTGWVCVSPCLPFGGDRCNVLEAAGLTTRKRDRLWIPVSCYLIEHPEGLVLYDCGWERAMSPEGVFDKKAQIASLGSRALYIVNQGMVEPGQTAREQLHAMGVEPEGLDYVLLSHLDCDHANGIPDLAGAKRFLVSPEEVACSKGTSFVSRTRFQSRWWEGVDLTTFAWNGEEGPAGKSFDLFGDGSLVLVNIPGHTDGLCALEVTGEGGRFVLLASDGAYAARSWEEMVLPGISMDREAQRRSLEWIAARAGDPLCVECLANHDPDVAPHVVEL